MENNDKAKSCELFDELFANGPSHLEVLADMEHVSVPISRYEELIRAETELNLVLRAYRADASYKLDYVLSAVFGSPEPDVPDGGEPDA